MKLFNTLIILKSHQIGKTAIISQLKQKIDQYETNHEMFKESQLT